MYDTQITLTGWIGGEVTLRELTEGRQVASFRVACTPSRLRDGEWVKGTTSWHTVKAWNRLARHVADSLHSGDPVVVHGRLVGRRVGARRQAADLVRGGGHGSRPRPLARHDELHQAGVAGGPGPGGPGRAAGRAPGRAPGRASQAAA